MKTYKFFECYKLWEENKKENYKMHGIVKIICKCWNTNLVVHR